MSDDPRDVVVFPVIDWYFRLQRPQQLAIQLGRRNHRVFYLTTTFTPEAEARSYLFCGNPATNVYVVQLRCPAPAPNIYKHAASNEHVEALSAALANLRSDLDIRATASIVDLPFWRPIAGAMPNNVLVYDCMDHHAGFANNEAAMLEEEQQLLREADLVITSSEGLHRMIGEVTPNVLIRNGCDVTHFLPRHDRPVRRMSEKPVVGYFGAIDHWYDVGLVAKAARSYPDWEFVLIGSTAGSDPAPLRELANVTLLGEIPYSTLPEYAMGFDVCLIPFLLTPLTLHTNPVKMYEYLAMGKPVVGTAMPEIRIGGDGLVYVGEDHEDFIRQLRRAMDARGDPAAIDRRIAYARTQTWSERIVQYEDAIGSIGLSSSN